MHTHHTLPLQCTLFMERVRVFCLVDAARAPTDSHTFCGFSLLHGTHGVGTVLRFYVVAMDLCLWGLGSSVGRAHVQTDAHTASAGARRRRPRRRRLAAALLSRTVQQAQPPRKLFCCGGAVGGWWRGGHQATCDDGLGLGSALPPPAGCPAGIPPASVVSAPRHPRVPSTAPPSLLRSPFIPSVAAAPVRGGRRRPAAAGHDAAGRRWRGPTRLKN